MSALTHQQPHRPTPAEVLVTLVLLTLAATAIVLLPRVIALATPSTPSDGVRPSVASTAPATAAQPEFETTVAGSAHPAASRVGPVAVALESAAVAHAVDVHLLRAVAWVESSHRPAARSHVGAVGVMQLMPDTITHAEQLLGRSINARYVVDNVDAGAAYLAHLLQRADGDPVVALAAYHQGWVGVARDGVSTTSHAYVARVLDLRAELSASR